MYGTNLQTPEKSLRKDDEFKKIGVTLLLSYLILIPETFVSKIETI